MVESCLTCHQKSASIIVLINLMILEVKMLGTKSSENHLSKENLKEQLDFKAMFAVFVK